MTQVTIEYDEFKRLTALDIQMELTPDVKDVVKSIDIEQRLFTALVLRPDVEDAHKDIYDAATVEKGCHNFNEYCRKANIQHLVQTSAIVFVESFIVKGDHTIGETEALKGDWIATARIDDDEIWELCKNGTFTGFSIGARATVEDLT